MPNIKFDAEFRKASCQLFAKLHQDYAPCVVEMFPVSKIDLKIIILILQCRIFEVKFSASIIINEKHF